MVYVPHRGELPARIGPGVPLIPDEIIPGRSSRPPA